MIVNMEWLERRGRDPQSAIGSRFELDQDRGGIARTVEGDGRGHPEHRPSADRVFANGTPVVFMAAAPGR